MPQSKPRATLDPSLVWVTKKQACRFLGVSERQIERRMDAGQLRHKKLPRESHQPVALVAVHVDDLKAIKGGTPNHYPGLVKAAQIPPELKQISAPAAAENSDLNSIEIARNHAAALENFSPGGIAATVKSDGVLPSLPELFAHLVAAAAAPIPRLWLTVEAAAERSGLPVYVLARAARRGEIVALCSRRRVVEGDKVRRRESWLLFWESVAAWRPSGRIAAQQTEDPPADEVLTAQATGVTRG
jgi:hypothetical protein